MDFTLSKEHEMARKLFHDFAENEVKPLAQEVDETEHFPEETVKKMQKLGFMGIPVPKEYDQYLTWLYADYMQMIPVSARRTSHSIVLTDLGAYGNFKI